MFRTISVIIRKNPTRFSTYLFIFRTQLVIIWTNSIIFRTNLDIFRTNPDIFRKKSDKFMTHAFGFFLLLILRLCLREHGTAGNLRLD